MNDTVAAALTLDLSVRGLTAGTYTVNLTGKATPTVTALGTFAVTDATTPTTASLVLGTLDPADLASVQIADATGTAVLTGDGDCRGGAVSGAEHLRETATLTAAATAPAGAAGAVFLEAGTAGGTTGAVLALHVKGLAAGTYTVNVTSLSAGTVTALGTFAVDSTGKGEVGFGSEDGTAFPAGFNPLDIGTVQVAAATGTALLSGDLTSAAAVTGGTYSARVKITAGAAAPASTGTAIIASRTVRHVVRQTFALTAKGAPASTTLTLKVNGVVAGQVKTSRVGTVSVRRLPTGTTASQVTSVTLETAAGTGVLGAYF